MGSKLVECDNNGDEGSEVGGSRVEVERNIKLRSGGKQEEELRRLKGKA